MPETPELARRLLEAAFNRGINTDAPWVTTFANHHPSWFPPGWLFARRPRGRGLRPDSGVFSPWRLANAIATRGRIFSFDIVPQFGGTDSDSYVDDNSLLQEISRACAVLLDDPRYPRRLVTWLRHILHEVYADSPAVTGDLVRQEIVERAPNKPDIFPYGTLFAIDLLLPDLSGPSADGWFKLLDERGKQGWNRWTSVWSREWHEARLEQILETLLARLSVRPDQWEDLREAVGRDLLRQMTGIVLIDEIDLHLHPIWQMHIIEDVRRLFPRLSFVVTTHNPLTLQGARPGEIFVMRRDDGGRIELTQRDIRPGHDVDRVLFEQFGIAYTFDQETRALLERHRALLERGVAPDDAERATLESQLAARLGRVGEVLTEERGEEHDPSRPWSDEDRRLLDRHAKRKG